MGGAIIITPPFQMGKLRLKEVTGHAQRHMSTSSCLTQPSLCSVVCISKRDLNLAVGFCAGPLQGGEAVCVGCSAGLWGMWAAAGVWHVQTRPSVVHPCCPWKVNPRCADINM